MEVSYDFELQLHVNKSINNIQSFPVSQVFGISLAAGFGKIFEILGNKSLKIYKSLKHLQGNTNIC